MLASCTDPQSKNKSFSSGGVEISGKSAAYCYADGLLHFVVLYDRQLLSTEGHTRSRTHGKGVTYEFSATLVDGQHVSIFYSPDEFRVNEEPVDPSQGRMLLVSLSGIAQVEHQMTLGRRQLRIRRSDESDAVIRRYVLDLATENTVLAAWLKSDELSGEEDEPP
jgi:hypothetical protein